MKVAQSCLTLCNLKDYTVHGIHQARILEWVAFPFSRGFSQPRDQTQVSRIAGRFLTIWAIRGGNPLQYSCLENSMDREARQATVHGVTRVRHDWVTNTHTHNVFCTFCLLFCTMQPKTLSTHSASVPPLLSQVADPLLSKDSHYLVRLLPIYLYRHTGNSHNDALELIIRFAVAYLRALTHTDGKCGLDRLLQWLVGTWNWTEISGSRKNNIEIFLKNVF